MRTHGPAPFSPVYHGMQFRAAPPEQPARQITALFATPATSKRNKDLPRLKIYVSGRLYKSGYDNVQFLLGKHCASLFHQPLRRAFQLNFPKEILVTRVPPKIRIVKKER